MRAEQVGNLPTKERTDQAEATGDELELVLHNITDTYHAQVIDPLRIDKLLRNKVLTKQQHKNGKKLFILHTLVERVFLKAVSYEDPAMRGMDTQSRNMIEENMAVRMTAQDIFYDVMAHLKRQQCVRVIRLVVIEEATVIEAARQCRVKPRNAVRYLHEAFRHLSCAFEEVKHKQEALQKLLDGESNS